MAGLPLPFTKMHGCANDYVVVDAVHHPVPDPEALALAVCDRRRGVGADGLLLALPSQTADLRMRMFNVDGSEAEMCGNGIRCLVKFAIERELLSPDPVGVIETKAGAMGYEVASTPEGGDPRIDAVTIRMGVPRLERTDIPMEGPSGQVISETLELGDGERLSVTAVSMGNPHAVTWVDDVEALELGRLGPRVEHHVAFPRRTNTEFVEVISPREVRQRTWERGCGETLACGTGACAVVVAGVLTGRTEREVLVHLRGGDLEIAWEEGGGVRMTGPAVEVFQGLWPLDGADAELGTER